MRTIDTRGQKCPAPLIATRKALKESVTGEDIEILTDNKTSFTNISRYLRENGILFSFVGENDNWRLKLKAGGQFADDRKAEEYCTTEIPHFKKGSFVVAITSDKTGEGSDELGKLLTVNFIRALMELDPLPSKMVFYNGGVKLCTRDSAVYGDLKKIEGMGVEILVCGTCIDFFSIREKIDVGLVSNMFEIVEIMAKASNIIKP